MQCIARHDKSLLLPQIVYQDRADVGGLYYEPGCYELELDGKFYDGKRGIIVVSTNEPNLMDATIYHEWRHHWQRHSVGCPPPWPWEPSDDYEASIRHYFTVWHEWDALMFEFKHARNVINDYWIGLISNPVLN